MKMQGNLLRAYHGVFYMIFKYMSHEKQQGREGKVMSQNF